MRRRNEAGTGRSNTCSGIMERIYIAKKSLGTKYLVRLQSIRFFAGAKPVFSDSPTKKKKQV